ncbi:MAG: hypothetical protein ACT6QS_06675 [Flavobacteriales bacterium]
MPDLSNIQTYERINGSDFSSVAERFASVLRNIDLWNAEIAETFTRAEWKEENGFVFSSLAQFGYFLSVYYGITIRPHVCIYTPAVDSIFTDTWMECSLLIEAEQLRRAADGAFYPHTYDLVKTISLAMHREFKQTGIYFTDEMQDGSDFEGITSNDKTKLWQFDYALVPTTLTTYYSDCPATHYIAEQDNYFEVWHRDRWKPVE